MYHYEITFERYDRVNMEYENVENITYTHTVDMSKEDFNKIVYDVKQSIMHNFRLNNGNEISDYDYLEEFNANMNNLGFGKTVKTLVRIK